MKVLLIDVNCKQSSTGKIVYDLYAGLKNQGHEAAICYGRGELVREDGIYKFGLDWETNIHAALARISGLNGCFSFFSTRRLIKYIDKFQPDIIHIHELHAYFVNIKPLIEYIKRKKIKVVWTFHCEYMYTGKCGYAYDCEKWKTTCSNCPSVKEYPKSLFFDMTERMFKMKKELLSDVEMTIVTPSQWLADRVSQSFLKNKTIKVIHNGINTDIFRPVDATVLRKELQIPDKNKVVLSVAPNIMNERKGGKYVLKLAEKMNKEDITFILVGGSNKSKKYRNVIMYGLISDLDKLVQLYSMADVFVICSSKETFSMTCAESLCCGTQIVGFESGAPQTIFKEPYAQFVAYSDLSKLSVAIKNNQAVDRKSITHYGVENFSAQNMVKRHIELYSAVWKEE